MSTKRKWHKGPPPHVGWWNASNDRSSEAWRWWNGYGWSSTAFSKETPRMAASYASTYDESGLPIEWTDYWPANARVPRINPEAK